MYVNADEHQHQGSMDLDGTSYKIHIGVRKWYLYLRRIVLAQHHGLGRGILFDGLLNEQHHEHDESLGSQL